MNTTIPISEARRRIFDIAEEVQAPHKYYVLTEKGNPKAVLLSADEYESLMETLEVLSLFPDIKERSKEADEAVRTGDFSKFVPIEVIECDLEEEKAKRKKDQRKSIVRTKHVPSQSKVRC